MKVLIAAILALFMAGSACAENVAIDAPPETRAGAAGHEGMYCYPEGDRVVDALYTALTVPDSVDVDIDPTGIPGWLHIVIPEEATLTRGRIVFTVPTSSPDLTTAPTYAAGDTIEFYIGEAKYDDWFKVTGWSSADLWLIGSAPGKVDVYWYVEKYTDSE